MHPELLSFKIIKKSFLAHLLFTKELEHWLGQHCRKQVNAKCFMLKIMGNVIALAKQQTIHMLVKTYVSHQFKAK